MALTFTRGMSVSHVQCSSILVRQCGYQPRVRRLILHWLAYTLKATDVITAGKLWELYIHFVNWHFRSTKYLEIETLTCEIWIIVVCVIVCTALICRIRHIFIHHPSSSSSSSSMFRVSPVIIQWSSAAAEWHSIVARIVSDAVTKVLQHFAATSVIIGWGVTRDTCHVAEARAAALLWWDESVNRWSCGPCQFTMNDPAASVVDEV